MISKEKVEKAYEETKKEVHETSEKCKEHAHKTHDHHVNKVKEYLY